MTNLQAPFDRDHLMSLLNDSEYLRVLLSRPEEQKSKNGRAFASLDELCRYYASCCRHLTTAELNFANECITRFYARWPQLPVPAENVFIVAIKEGAALEFGHTSFTIGSVILMHASNVGSCQIVCHEYVHVLERLCRPWFHANVIPEFRPVALGDALARTDGTVAIVTNPDDETPYVDVNHDAVFYAYNGNQLQPVVVNLRNPSDHQRYLGDSVVERFAVNLTKELN
jgi:hypothetical protein